MGKNGVQLYKRVLVTETVSHASFSVNFVEGILVTRMFGQKSKASLSSNMMTLQEFSAHFPELLNFVSQKLDLWLVHRDRITEIQPSLFLVLTLLANLGPSADVCPDDRYAPTGFSYVTLVAFSSVDKQTIVISEKCCDKCPFKLCLNKIFFFFFFFF